jgi:ABC-type dipeptide/oligopeptide/nickel transport system permease component
MLSFFGDHMLSIIKFLIGSVYIVFLIVPYYMAKYFKQMEEQEKWDQWNEQREKYKLSVRKRKKRSVNF